MRSTWRAPAAIVGGVLVLLPRHVAASDALWIQPSGQWFGIDGTWSSFSFKVGSTQQSVDLTVSTTLSETWVISTGGCYANTPCTAARGGLFDIAASSSWTALGTYQLGLPQLNQGGNGDYGLDTLSWTDTLSSTTTTVTGALIGAINDTDYFQGFIGIGANTVKLGSNVTDSVIAQLAEDYGAIPSHSYGYTAGAHYIGSNGTVGSLVLGGYDTLRYTPHSTSFTLDPNTRSPSVRVRGVTATISSLDKAPTQWNSTQQTLVAMKDSVVAVIDTSTPYLWMPTIACERFAALFNLTWSDDYGVYLFPDTEAYTKFLDAESLSIVFSLSSFENSDITGPLNVPGIVNITISPAAFAQTLRYPFKNLISYGAPGVPYFPLKRQNLTGTNKYVIGRAFMQEAYLRMNYDNEVFSVHQALFPDNAATNFSVYSLARPSDSIYPPYAAPSGKTKLTTPQMVGVVVGSFGAGILIALAAWYCCRLRRKAKQQAVDPNKEDIESLEDEQPRSPVRRMFSMIIGRKRSRRPVANEVHGDSTQPTEVAADASHELYELPVPLEPVELDSTTYAGDDMTDLGSEGTAPVSEYEMARRKLERQLQGPVPAYSPPLGEPEKTMQDVSPVPHYRPSDEPSPGSSPTYGSNTNSLPDYLPSPITPHPGEGTRHFDFPSPLAVVPPLPSPLSPRFSANTSDPSSGTYSLPSPNSPNSPHHTYEPSSVSRSNSSNVSPTSPTRLNIPAPAYQRTPIDPSRVVCLGPLPENVQLQLPPNPTRTVPRLITPDGQLIIPTPGDAGLIGGLAPADLHARDRLGSVDTLGSNFTVEEEGRIHDEVVRQQSVRRAEATEGEDSHPRSPHSMERIDAASELVHVPQVADKRYSWEEERTT
ncbi:acid protease [Thozetella sp. PMI_491]|nr:acid protease [Thozetella sp. PMI_491]